MPNHYHKHEYRMLIGEELVTQYTFDDGRVTSLARIQSATMTFAKWLAKVEQVERWIEGIQVTAPALPSTCPGVDITEEYESDADGVSAAINVGGATVNAVWSKANRQLTIRPRDAFDLCFPSFVYWQVTCSRKMQELVLLGELVT